MALNAYFKASFGLSDFQAALNYARHSRQIEHTVYVIIESTGDDDTFEVDQIQWSREPNSEKIADPDERLRQCLITYGSHYIATLRYSLRISLRGALQSLDQSMVASFSAAYSSWGVSAGVDASAARALRQMNVQFAAEVVAGSIAPEQYANRWIMTSFDDIEDFLDKLRNGTITVTRAPIQAALTNYWGTLVGYPNTRQVLAFDPGQPPLAPFGVPQGTILPWWPNSADTQEKVDPTTGNIVRAIAPPNGWAICDGTANTPNLIGRFLAGVGSLAEVGRTGGRSSHAHGGTTKDVYTADGPYNVGDRQPPGCVGLSHKHYIDTDGADHTPPFVGLLYIMKL